MATIEECRAALDKLSDNLAGAEGDVRSAAALDRFAKAWGSGRVKLEAGLLDLFRLRSLL